jgi:hypothetical protein
MKIQHKTSITLVEHLALQTSAAAMACYGMRESLLDELSRYNEDPSPVDHQVINKLARAKDLLYEASLELRECAAAVKGEA